MRVTALGLAERFLGLDELAGDENTPLIVGMAQVVKSDMRGGVGLGGVGRLPADDETPWCAVYVGFIAYLLNLPRPARHSDPVVRGLALRARSWLRIGNEIALADAKPGWDCVVFNRGGPADPAIINAPGHVGLYVSHSGDSVVVRGGNQGNKVSDRAYPINDILGVRRWWSGDPF